MSEMQKCGQCGRPVFALSAPDPIRDCVAALYRQDRAVPSHVEAECHAVAAATKDLRAQLAASNKQLAEVTRERDALRHAIDLVAETRKAERAGRAALMAEPQRTFADLIADPEIQAWAVTEDMRDTHEKFVSFAALYMGAQAAFAQAPNMMTQWAELGDGYTLGLTLAKPGAKTAEQINDEVIHERDTARAEIATLTAQRDRCVCQIDGTGAAVWNMAAADMHAAEVAKLSREFADYRDASVRDVRALMAQLDDARARFEAALAQHVALAERGLLPEESEVPCRRRPETGASDECGVAPTAWCATARDFVCVEHDCGDCASCRGGEKS